MSFTAIDKKTGQLFLVAGETGKDGILHNACLPIRPDIAYAGNLLDGSLRNSIWECSRPVLAVIDGDQLEEVKGDLTIRFIREPAATP